MQHAISRKPHTVQVSDLIGWTQEHRVLFANSTFERKALYINFSGGYVVMVGEKIVHEGIHPTIAVKVYNEITSEYTEATQQDTPEQIATEREAYREGQIAWAYFDAGNTPHGNPYPTDTPQHTAWNRGFNVGA